jgi:hypothetical protein
MKEYLLLIREDLGTYGQMTPEQMQQDIEEHMRWVETLVQNGNFKGGNPLMPMGTHIRGTEALVTDGPYIEAKEGISGYYFLLASSLEDVTEIAKGCPSLRHGGTVELREVIQTGEGH